MQIEGSLGTMTIHDDVIAGLAGLAVLETYGIVGMSGPGPGLADLLYRESFQRGIKISETGGLKIDAYVIAAYGVRIPEVARQARDNIAQAVVEALGVKPDRVTVHVTGVKSVDTMP
jgi:uncharacterized alkaline shock family protein YloU